jgi:predicted SAM-dependent methyltransferase
MLNRLTKASFYRLAGPFMLLNGNFHRLLRSPRAGVHKVHLGPGRENYLADWINVDANVFTAKCDVWTDFTRRLPFHSNTIDAVYSHHVIEHLPDLDRHFAEVYRCLKLGGIYRVGGPNGDNAIRKFVEEDVDWFSDYPEKRQSIGGKFNNFLLCRNEHLAILTESYLRELMGAAGFRDIVSCMPTRETRRPDIFEPCLRHEFEDDFKTPHTILLEGTK